MAEEVGGRLRGGFEGGLEAGFQRRLPAPHFFPLASCAPQLLRHLSLHVRQHVGVCVGDGSQEQSLYVVIVYVDSFFRSFLYFQNPSTAKATPAAPINVGTKLSLSVHNIAKAIKSTAGTNDLIKRFIMGSDFFSAMFLRLFCREYVVGWGRPSSPAPPKHGKVTRHFRVRHPREHSIISPSS